MNNIDELERHLDLLNEVLNSDNESDANEDELYERRIEVRRRMVPFYRQRVDIVTARPFRAGTTREKTANVY